MTRSIVFSSIARNISRPRHTEPSRRSGICGSLLLAGALTCSLTDSRAQTYCNPINLNYGLSAARRHAADPVIIRFQGRYYLFSTSNRPGYHVSEDLLHWRLIPWDKESVKAAGLEKLARESYAPAVAVHGEYCYYFEPSDGKKGHTTPLLRTKDPLSGQWEKCADLGPDYTDPDLFFDDDDRVYVIFGMSGPRIAELDSTTFAEINGTRHELLPPYPGIAKTPYGVERGLGDIESAHNTLTDVVDTSAFLGKFSHGPAREGNWLTKHQGHYYVQWATPGTAMAWYCDEAAEAESPMGPFHQYDSPVSLKVGGFISSAGHSCTFEDKAGTLWEVTTMWVGIGDGYERRLGLFPVHFHQDGHMHVDTAFGDLPRRLSDGATAGWWVQSFGKPCTASSSMADHPPEAAADENVRTWWSAKTGDPAEWLQMDLGKNCRINAIQINFAEQDASHRENDPDDFHAYRLLVSDDAKTWRPLVDKSASTVCIPHDYVELPAAETGRYLKLENVHTASHGKFAVRDLRVFGNGLGQASAPVSETKITRHTDDDRDVTVEWKPVAGADGYLIRYGTDPDALDTPVQVQGGQKDKLTFHALTRGARYFWRIDSYNDSGSTPGEVIRPTSGN